LKNKTSTTLKPINYLRILAALYCIWLILTGTSKEHYLLWNLFLAWIPLELSILIDKLIHRNKTKYKLCFIIILGVLWLLFYPNAPYMVTDFIHLSNNKYSIINPNYTPHSGLPRMVFNDSYKVWFDLINITLGVCLAWVSGFFSLHIHQKNITKKYGGFSAWIFVIIINLLGGFAIYLGRFIRWNSWDVIVNPQNIIAILIKDLNFKSLYFTLMFGIFYFTLYAISYIALQFKSIEN
jgi:uncharacterized membrane protein